MAYIGNQTTTSFSSMAKHSITGDGGTGYTLDHAVANAQEIEVFVNNVRQEPGVAYTVSGTTLTMTGNVVSTDDFYVVYQGLAVQTSVPGDNTVTTAMLQDDAATAAKVDSTLHLSTIKDSSGTNTAITIDSSGRVLTPARPAFNVNGIAGGDPTMSGNSGPNNPFFITHATADLNQGNCWSSSTGKFTAPISGVYHFYAAITYKNKNERWVSGGFFNDAGNSYTTNGYHGMSLMDDVEGTTQYASVGPSMTILLSANDTVRVGAFSDDGDAGLWSAGNHFGGYLVG